MLIHNHLCQSLVDDKLNIELTMTHGEAISTIIIIKKNITLINQSRSAVPWIVNIL